MKKNIKVNYKSIFKYDDHHETVQFKSDGIYEKGFDKENSIHLLLKYLNVDPKDAIAFGDGVVDIPMFKACGFSVAMGNGNDKVKEAASYVTDEVDHDGLYNAFKYLKLI